MHHLILAQQDKEKGLTTWKISHFLCIIVIIILSIAANESLISCGKLSNQNKNVRNEKEERKKRKEKKKRIEMEKMKWNEREPEKVWEWELERERQSVCNVYVKKEEEWMRKGANEWVSEKEKAIVGEKKRKKEKEMVEWCVCMCVFEYEENTERNGWEKQVESKTKYWFENNLFIVQYAIFSSISQFLFLFFFFFFWFHFCYNFLFLGDVFVCG